MEVLEPALKEAGIEATIDMRKGTVTVDSNFLFINAQSNLTKAGKESLEEFIDVIAEVIKNGEYAGSVTILIEGHTCSNGGYDYNMRLSESRAKAVMEYIVELHEELADKIETVGRSYDELSKDENGNVDSTASRRVVFVFRTPVA